MKKKCNIVFVDNLKQVVDSQRDYFQMILENIKKTYSENLMSLKVASDEDQLLVAIDNYEFVFSHNIVILSLDSDDDEIEEVVDNVVKNIDDSVKTLFVVDLCLDLPENTELITGLSFGSKLCKNYKNKNIKVAFCTGVLHYDRVKKIQDVKTLNVFHRALVPGEIFSSDEFIFEESIYKTALSKYKPSKNNAELLFLLDKLINNPFQNTQYLGDLLMSAFLFCEGKDEV